jgi:sugar phosphate isomerase/epimerase
MNIEEADPLQALVDAGPWIRHIQLSDSNRLEPGSGHIDWAATLETIASIGYTDELAYEGRLSGPVDEVLPTSVQLLRQAAEGRENLKPDARFTANRASPACR